MAKKYGLGGMLFFGAVTAALGGIAAYKHRKEIEQAVEEITDQLDELREENGFFSVEPDGDTVVHPVSNPDPEEDLDDQPEEGRSDADPIETSTATETPVESQETPEV